MNLNDLQSLDLDFENMGSWPPLVKLVVAILTMILVAGAGYWFLIKSTQQRYQSVTEEETKLKQQYRIYYNQAANLEVYNTQMTTLEGMFADLREQLPKETEIPALLEDISAAGQGQGLEFNAIKLQKEADNDFYKTLPIRIEVTGGYHQLGEFISQLANMSRIVTVHNFTINNNSNAANKLKMTLTANTYHYGGDQGDTP